MTTAEKILRAKQDYDDVYKSGQSSMMDESKIIPKTMSGNPVVVRDVSEIPHDLTVQLTSDTIEDFSGIEVAQQGKNIYGYIKSRITNATRIEELENGVIAKGNQSETDAESLSTRGTLGSGYDNTSAICPRVFEGQTITLSADVTLLEIGNSPSPNKLTTYIYIQGGNNAYSKSFTLDLNVKQRISHTFTIEEKYSGKVIYPVFRLNSNTLRIENIQFEYNNVATPYEPYKEYRGTANSNGIVEGLKSISPKMSLYSNADVDIELTYNKSWGMDYEWNKFWDIFQKQDYDGSASHNSQRRFHGYWWGWDNFYPKYDIKIKGSGNEGFYTFASNDGRVQSLKSRLEECRVKLDTSEMTACASTFAYSYISELPALDFTGITKASSVTFGHCWARLKKIELIKVTKSITYSSWFVNDNGLTYIRFEGDIGNSIDFKSSPLDKASITNIIEHLCTDTDVTGQTLTLKESAVNAAFGIDASDATTWTEEWINLIRDKSNSYNGNWNISFA